MAKPQPLPERVSSLQMLRGLAAMLVVWLHSIDIADGFPSAFNRAFLPGIPELHDFGASGVDLFFVISGFAMSVSLSANTRTSGQFILQRIIRIVPLYWLAAGSFALFAGAFERPDANDEIVNLVTILPIFSGDTYETPALFVGWTLMFEFIFYAQVALIMAIRPRKPLLWLSLLTLSCALLSQLFGGGVFMRTLFNPIAIEFSLGIFAYWLWRWKLAPVLAMSALIAGIAVLSAEVLLGLSPKIDADFIAAIDGETGVQRVLSWGIPWFAILVGTVCSVRTVPAWLRAIGDASFSIYLTHLFAITAAQQLVLVAKDQNPYFWVLASCVFSLALGLLVHSRVEAPMTAWLNAAVRKFGRPLPTSSQPAREITV